jgi:hypothetical protein
MAITKIAEVNGTGSSGSIVFTSIPQTYTDLLLVISGRTTATGNHVSTLQFNSNSGANYNFRFLQGTGGAASSGAATSTTSFQIGYVNDAGTTSNTFCNQSVYIPNYTSSTAKSMSVDSVQENNGAQGLGWINAGSWSLTSAITAIDCGVSSGFWTSTSTVSLYGITKGSGGASVS